MNARDLAQLDYLCARGTCVSLGIIHDGDRRGTTIGLRHDVDDRGWPSTLPLARWEARRGRRSTFYFLPTAPYWGTKDFVDRVREIKYLGHGIGLHVNAVAEWWNDRSINPFDRVKLQVAALEGWSGARIRSMAGHGDDACYEGRFVNYSMFEECPVKTEGFKSFEDATGMQPRPLSEFGFEYAGDHVPRSCYLSDSGDVWNVSPAAALADFPYETNTVILQHPDWYEAGLFA